jgi:hypothetical protein
MRLPSLALLAASLVLGSPGSTASAEVLVVDPANGPGTDFTSLSAAIAAAATGDVLLLRSGNYQGAFVVAGKSLSIVADEGAQVTISNSGTGGPVAAALQLGSHDFHPVVVRGLTLTTSAANHIPLRIIGQPGSGGFVFVEECNVPVSGDVAVELANRFPVVLSRCALNGADGSLATGLLGRPAAISLDGAIACFGGSYIGGAGREAGLLGPLQVPVPGQDGAPGLQIDIQGFLAGFTVLSGAAFIGGLGGDGAAPGGSCLPPGDGGDGVLHASGNDDVLFAGFGIGDLGGTAAPGCGPDGEQGQLLASIPPAPMPSFMAGAPASVTLPRVRREGQPLPVLVQGVLDPTVSLLIGFEPQYAWTPAMNGVQVVQDIAVTDLGELPFANSVTLRWRTPQLPPGVESGFLYVQPVSTQPSGVATLGQPSVMLILDSSF